MNGEEITTLVIGVGNVLMQDEGAGVRAVELLESRFQVPEHVEFLDGGTAGTELLEPMRGKQRLIIADCVNTGAPPGTLVRLTDDEIPAFFQTKISNHQLGISDLLAVLTVTGESPQHVTIIGMVPYCMENKLGLSEESTARLEEMVQMLVDELAVAGIELQPRREPLRCFWDEQGRLESTVCA
ncbi:MAG: HyaD/HybD family hydrogenase maturation endopeptidase [Candidatus Sedimenticola sp. 4PFRAG1]